MCILDQIMLLTCTGITHINTNKMSVCVCVCVCVCVRMRVYVRVVVDWFYTQLFSALEQIHCTLVICDFE